MSPLLAAGFLTSKPPLSYNEGSPHCSFDLHFSNSDVEQLFMCLVAIGNLEKIVQVNLSAKQKQRHRHREQKYEG